MRNWDNDFAYYQGETFITLGSLQEIHEYTGIPLERLKEYSKKSRIKRYPFGRMLIEIDEELS